MKRRAFVSIFGGAAVLASPLPVRAQPAPKVPRLGYLAVGLPSPSRAFLQAMHDLGYVEGHNVLVEYRGAEGKPLRPGLGACIGACDNARHYKGLGDVRRA